MICAHERSGDLQGVRLARGCPPLTHCMFADDTIVFLKADRNNCLNFKQILGMYCEASGQAINFSKSNLFFSRNTPDDVREEIGCCLGVVEVEDPGHYLGLPVLWGGSRQKALAYVRDKVGKKVMGLQKKCLSFAGREIMIKAVVNAIPIYPMSCFKFPAGSCKELNSLVANFFWSNSSASATLHWKAWEKLTDPKTDGGLGFKDFMCFNDALLAKTAWRILVHPEDYWAKVLKSIYFPTTSFLLE